MTDDEARRLLERAGCSPDVIRHSEAVAALAAAIASRIPGCDAASVRVGALLHDIGRGRTHGIDHASRGARLASRMGVPGEVCEIIRTHVGGGITAREAVELGLPPEDFRPSSLEAKIVAHADNLVAGTARRPVAEVLKAYAARGLHRAAERVARLHEELSSLAGTDIDTVGEE